MFTNVLIAIFMTLLSAGAAVPGTAPTSKLPNLIIGVEPQAYEIKPFIQGLSRSYRAIKSHPVLRHLVDFPLYQIDLELDLLLGRASVVEQINYKNTGKRSLSNIVLRTLANAPTMCTKDQANLVISDVTINNKTASIRKLSPTVYELALPSPLKPGHRVLLGLTYNLTLPVLPVQATVPGGVITPEDMMKQVFGKKAPSGYGVLGQAQGIFNLGYFYPVLASRNNGVWDTTEPSGMGDMSNFQVANYQVKVTLAQNALCATSGIQVGTNPLGSGPAASMEHYFIGTAIRNFAMQVSTRYEVAEKKTKKANIRFIYLPEHKSSVASTLDHIAMAVDTYSRLFGPYPYPEFDLVEAPLMGGAGGIEYPGMVTVAMGLGAVQAKSSFNSPAAALMSSTNTYEFVLAHEVAHQWFNGLVGSDSNKYPFLDEALANYAAVLYFEAKNDSNAAQEQFQTQLVVPYQMMRAMGGRDAPANLPTSAYANQLQYSAIIYGKAAFFVHTLRRKIGRKRFFKAMRKYVRRFSFRQATPMGFLDTVASASGKPKLVRGLYKRWIEQRHGDEDIGMADLNKAMGQLMQQAASMKGFHNYKIQGLDPATLRMFQRALQQMQGP